MQGYGLGNPFCNLLVLVLQVLRANAANKAHQSSINLKTALLVPFIFIVYTLKLENQHSQIAKWISQTISLHSFNKRMDFTKFSQLWQPHIVLGLGGCMRYLLLAACNDLKLHNMCI